jgi:dolichol-phosphate mannosyltransferase
MLSFVFPAYNEADNLRRFPAEVFPAFDALREPYEIVVVDDGSRDDTAEVARSLGEPVRLVPHARNMGLGAAIKTGIAAARGDLIITMDSDLTFAPTLVPALLARFRQGDVDVVCGSPKLAGFAPNIPAYRIGMSKVATLLYSVVLGRRVTAVSPIFRLYRREDVQGLDVKTNGFDINAEILFKLIQAGKRIAEIPAPLTQRLHGESKLVYSKEIQRHLRLLGTMAKWRCAQWVGVARG